MGGPTDQTESCFLKGNYCSKYHAIAQLFWVFLWFPLPANHSGRSLSTDLCSSLSRSCYAMIAVGTKQLGTGTSDITWLG